MVGTLNFWRASQAQSATRGSTYTWNVWIGNQAPLPIDHLTTATVVDTSASPAVTYDPVNQNLRIVPDNSVDGMGETGYTITVTSATPVPSTDVAQLTLDGATTKGTF